MLIAALWEATHKSTVWINRIANGAAILASAENLVASELMHWLDFPVGQAECNR
jgi:hypothetical protein